MPWDMARLTVLQWQALRDARLAVPAPPPSLSPAAGSAGERYNDSSMADAVARLRARCPGHPSFDLSEVIAEVNRGGSA